MKNTKKVATVIYPNHDLSFFEMGDEQFHPEEEYCELRGIDADAEEAWDLPERPDFIKFVKQELRNHGVTHVVDSEVQEEEMGLEEYFACLWG